MVSYLSPDRLAIPDGSFLHLFTLQLPPTSQRRSAASPAKSPPPPPSPYPPPFLLAASIPLKAPVSLLNLHADGRLCSAAPKEKVLRLHSTLPTFPTSSSSSPFLPSLVHLRHDRASPVVTCVLSLNPSRLLIGFEDGSLHCYNTRTGAKVYSLSLDCALLALIPTSSALAAASLTSSIISSPSSQLSYAVSSATSTPSTSHVFAYTADKTFRLLDLHLCRVARYIGSINYMRSAFVLDHAGRVAITSGQSVFIWRLDTWTCERTLDREEEIAAEAAATAAAVDPTATTEPWAEEKQQRVEVCRATWNGRRTAPDFPPPSSTRQPSFVCPLWSSGWLASGTSEGWLHLWRVAVHSSQRRMCGVRAHRGRITHLQYVRERRLLSCGADGAVRVWQLHIRGERRGEDDDGEEVGEREGGETEWSLRLLFQYEVQSCEGWCGSASYIPGD